MRLAIWAAVAALGSCPYARHYELERARSMQYLAGALCLVAAPYLDGFEDVIDAETEVEVVGLALAAAMPLMRRNVVVQHDVRLSFERLDALFGDSLPSFGTPLNVVADVRFRLEDLPRLAAALCVPHSFSTRSRHRFSGIEGMLILLKRLAYPQRLIDLVDTGHNPSALSEGLTVRARRFCLALHRHMARATRARPL
jgi:hypothetical protein